MDFNKQKYFDFDQNFANEPTSSFARAIDGLHQSDYTSDNSVESLESVSEREFFENFFGNENVLKPVNHSDLAQEGPRLVDITDLRQPLKREPQDFEITPEPTEVKQESEMMPIKKEKFEGMIFCPICGNEAGKHMHYGGRACTSCRAFFRRSVQNEAFKKFSCSSKNCTIDSKSWRSCKWCRFQKCIDNGLQPGWVLNEEEREARQKKRKIGSTSKAKLIPPHPQSTSLALVQKSESRFSSLNNDELLLVMNRASNLRNGIIENLFKFYARNKNLFGKLSRAVYTNTIVPYNVYTKWETIWPSTIPAITAEQSKLVTVPPHPDNELLLRQNFPVIQVLLQSTLMMNTQYFRFSTLAEILTRSLTMNPGRNNPEDVKVLHDVLNQIGVRNHLPQSALRYEQVFATPWAGSIMDEERHAQIIAQLGNWSVDHTSPQLLVDQSKLYLIINLLLLSTEGVDVQDRHRISKLQDMHLNLLCRYLKYKYNDDAHEHLLQGLMIMSLAREAIKIQSQRLPV